MSPEGPGEHPPPPDDLFERALPRVETAETLWRIYRNEYPEPLFFGKRVHNRFDSPEGEFGVCYCAVDRYGAFVETFGHSAGTNLLTREALAARSLVEVEVTTLVTLIDLTGEGLKKVGADSRLTGGSDYGLSQEWAEAFYEHPGEFDGIYYRSRNDPSRMSAAIFERSSEKLVVKRAVVLGDQEGLEEVMDVIDHYGFGLG